MPRVRPTRLGVKATAFYTLLFCAFFAAPYLNLFFLLLSFCSVLAVLNLWWGLRNLAGVGGKLEDAVPMPAGASQIGQAVITCGRRTRRDLAIRVVIDGLAANVVDAFELTPGDPQRVEVVFPALPRGVHRIDRAHVCSTFPFGMMSVGRELAAPAQVVVYPAPADLARYRDRSEIASQGLGGSLAAEMGPAGLREYRQGDELRNVHWKASARRRELVVKEFEGDAAPGLEVLLDLRAEPEDLEEALSLIAALAIECRENKELLTLGAQDHRGTYGKGHQAFDRLLAYLAAASPLAADAAAPPAVSPGVLRLPLPGRRARARSNRPFEESTC